MAGRGDPSAAVEKGRIDMRTGLNRCTGALDTSLALASSAGAMLLVPLAMVAAASLAIV